MDANWTSSPWIVFMTLAMGMGAAVITWIVLRIWSQPKLPADMAAARDDLELGARRIIRKNIELMEAVRDMATLCQSLPAEYQPVALQVMKLAQVMEEAAYADGANQNVFPRPMFNAAGGPPQPPMMPIPDTPTKPEETVPESSPRPVNVVPIHYQTINGQILRAG